jgi:signal transduction histidine kinase
MNKITQINKDKVLIPFITALPIISFIFAAIHYFKHDTKTLHITLMICGSLAWLTYPLKKYFNADTFYTHFVILILLCGQGLVSYFSGAILSSTIWWAIFIPIMASLLTSMRSTLIWIGITIVAMVLIYQANIGNLPYIQELQHIPPEERTARSFFIFFLGIAALSVTLKIVFGKILRERDQLQEQSIVNTNFKVINQLTSSIAHEINNPLFVIHGHTELVLHKLQNTEFEGKEEILNSLEKSLRACLQASQKISTLSDLTSNISKESKTRFSILTKLEEYVKLNKKNYLIKNIEMKLLDRTLGKSIVYLNQNEIMQALINIINNSYEAVRGTLNGWIKFELYTEENLLNIKIIDSGQPLSQEERTKIFSHFYSTKNKENATGLGLSISKALIERNGGSIVIDQESENTTFVVKLPLDETTENLA